MKTFLLILLFGKSILLTSGTIDLDDKWLVLLPKKPIEAITSGASLFIQVSMDDPLIKGLSEEDNIFSRLNELFPKEMLTAKLIDKEGNEIVMAHTSYAVSDFTFKDPGSLRLIISAIDKSIPTDTEFVKVMIKSSIRLEKVRIYWKNYSE